MTKKENPSLGMDRRVWIWAAVGAVTGLVLGYSMNPGYTIPAGMFGFFLGAGMGFVFTPAKRKGDEAADTAPPE